MNILHVEDSKVYARLIQEELTDLYGSGSLAITNATTLSKVSALIAAGNTYDVILLDLSLPDAKGYEAIEVMDDLCHTMPIVVLSGEGQRSKGLHSVELGAQDYLMKEDVTPGLLEKTIQYAIERNRSEQQELITAMTDPLTSLPNRTYFYEHFKASVERAKRSKLSLILLFIDFDGFKQLNDTYGHQEGDNFLKEVGGRFLQVSRKSDFCARFGGDEFVVLIETEHKSIAMVVPFLENLLKVMRLPFYLATGQSLGSRCSIGVSLYDPVNDENKPIDEILEEADHAMYKAKEDGGDCFRVHESLLNQSVSKCESQNLYFRNCLKYRGFELYFQQIIDSESNTLAGVECKIKIKSKFKDYVSTAEFIQYLECNKLIFNFGESILNEAITSFLNVTQNIQQRDLFLSVNVSPLQIKQPEFLEFVKLQLCQTPRTDWLVLELSMQALLEETVETLIMLKEYQKLGVKIAIDHFAIGSCKLAELLSLPVDIYKFDSTLLTKNRGEVISTNSVDIGVKRNNEAQFTLTCALLQLAQSLGKTTIITGVSSVNDSLKFTNHGADFQQGALFSLNLTQEQLFHNLNLSEEALQQ